ncbi:alpha/beta hydrolase family protein [Aureimonas glaciei]|uniref:Phospholipase/carboxylesterase n=1 Tax=Aureimonas glaciei TaxID=1776957 RepID=A0A917DC88_9HYPH|nr:alpha/beta hydrolase [Aureimonas glaciei]GGD25240.1 phospholipase/carboxylesterase [Aureimonas glaciei]
MARSPAKRPFFAAAAWAILSGIALAAPAQLAPFKDALFAYPPLTAIGDGGDFIDVDYSELRDINGRDEIPERRAKAAYVDRAPLATQEEASLPTPAGPLAIMTVGNAKTPTSIVLFIHGRNGDRRLGMNDWTFGGNFNRLKNLLSRAGGLYVTADAGSFSGADRTRVGTLVETLGRDHPQATIVLACASMGGEFCWDLAGDAAVTRHVDGLVMLSANTPPTKLAAMRKAAGARQIPLLLAHGTRDKVFAWDDAKAVYTALRSGGYPVRFVSFETGNHGTPIRMIDWRDSLNWVFQKAAP